MGRGRPRGQDKTGISRRLIHFRRSQVRALVLCVIAGALFAWLKLPLPWMIGPLLAMAVGKANGFELEGPRLAREGGQTIIAVALGLYFTPQVAAGVVNFVPWMFAAGLFALALGLVSSAIVRILMGRNANGDREIDGATAFFGSVPGGATEMAVQAERFGGRVDRVAFAQSFRILVVVLTLPFIYRYADIHGLDPYVQGPQAVNAPGLALLFALALGGGFLLALARAPNAFMLGPLLTVIVLTAADFNLSALPGWLSAIGQLLLGCSLGAKFERDFFRAAPRFMFAVAAATLVAISLSVVFATGLWRFAGIHLATGVLAVAPGGIAEMCITAKVMQVGVPVVTTFHIARVVFLVLFAGPAFAWFRNGSRKSS